ncbi:low temperature requirement protein A [Tsukamurella ocularis]|uniref:low temperature requirement protein A n=1 Tax=Tsukamurella ocularis TaxID=1970234 RepID=UPI002169A340|nr:low temperature requirement protein A [Tsukamurella ocularis]MCS3778721.1 low temperature requirement protein LtrA [Tsukamurella ocularis]MCS3789422.1 low temperature requirement protein LtrA [Tsukamurella ocularis]MCS3851404.1 low temperature requirement protein LtrA [Tsukamurella ocularis]
MTDGPSAVRRRLTRMAGRDPHEEGRTATTLELFFDLTFVVVFSLAGVQLADAIAEAHYFTAFLGFGLCAFAAVWAWINFTWMASAFDTDDWLFRAVTMLQMIGVCIMALGVEPFFTSVTAGVQPNNTVLVIGYVVMRVALLAQWTRVAFSSPRYRSAAVTYIIAITVAQIGWVFSAFAPLTLTQFIVFGLILFAVELGGPVVAELRQRTPWNPHHIAERYGLLTIITLGEGVVGTVVALQALLKAQGWSLDIAVLGVSAMVLNLSIWWIYFSIPVGHALVRTPNKCFAWGYGHIVIFMAIAAFGAGLHVEALGISHEAHVSNVVVASAFILPLAVAVLGIEIMDAYLCGFDGHRAVTVGITLALLGAGVAAVVAGATPLAALVWSAIALLVQVVVEELWSGKRRAERLA